MAAHDYHFTTYWRVEGNVEEVFAIVSDTAHLARWWSAAFPEVQELEPGDEQGVGRLVNLRTRGFLPYSLFWQSRITESRPPHGFTVEVQGDFVGRGIWSFEQDGPWVNITFDWKIHVEKPLVRYLSFFLRPLFATNHRWAMARGEEGLRLEIARRRAAGTQAGREDISIPAPSAPRSDALVWLVTGLLAVVLAVVVAGAIQGYSTA